MKGRTDVNQYTPPHTFSKLGYKYIIIILHTKYDNSSLHSFTEIFTEFQYLKYGKKENWTNSSHSLAEIFDEKFHHSKYGKKENRTNTGKNKHEKAGSQSHDTIHHYQPAYQI